MTIEVERVSQFPRIGWDAKRLTEDEWVWAPTRRWAIRRAVRWARKRDKIKGSYARVEAS